MLNTSSPAQRLSDEDSSGSDPEPETDRFGFILTNGSTAGCVGPSPELVRQREAKWINIISQWNRILLKKTNKVKVQCQKGIPASLRAKCWPLLCGATDKMKQNQTLYESLNSQAALQSWVDVIERDLDRQFPFHEMFLSKDGHGQRGLFRVLKAYTQYQPEEGYCQAQGPVAAVLLMNMPAEEAFWCLVQISEQYLPGYYSPLLEGVLFDAAMLTWVLKRTCPAAHKHLQQHGVEPLMFATDWLMCLFTRHLPFNTLLRVWDLFFCFGVRVLLQVAVVLVRRVLGRADQRRQCEGQMETLEILRGVRDQVQEEDDTFIAEVCSVPLSVKDLEKQTEKQLEKWRKDRPSSTFDPRNRCHGYRMAWARARHAEEEQEKREREKGNLSVPLTRSASTLSLSPSLLQRWRKGGKANTGEWEGGGKVVRHLSMGAREDCKSLTELQFMKVKEVQEEDDVVFDEHKHSEISPIVQKEQLKEPENMNKTQNMQTEDAVIVEEQPDKRINKEEESQREGIKESRTLCKEGDEAKEDKQNIEVNSSRQSQALPLQSHESREQEPEAKSENKETAGSEQPAAVEDNQPEIHNDADSNKETEPEGGTGSCEEQMSQTDVEPDECTETKNGQQTMQGTLRETINATVQYPVVETESQQQIQEQDKDTQGHELEEKQLCNESLAEAERSGICAEMETDILALNSSELEIMERKDSEHVNSEREAVAITLCSPECVDPKEGSELESEQEVTSRNDALMDESNSRSETECSTRAQREDKEIDLKLKVDNDQTQAEEVPTQSQTNEETTDILGTATNSEQYNLRVVADESKVEGEPTTEEANIHIKTHQQIQEQDKDSQKDELEENQLCNKSLIEAEKSDICAEMEKDILTLNSSELEIVERKVSEHVDSEKDTVAITLCSPECVDPKEGSELESEQETISKNDAVMDESNTRSETECSTWVQREDKEIISTVDLKLKLDNAQTQAEEVLTQSQTNEEKTDILGTATNSEEVNLRVDADENKVEEEPTTEAANISLKTLQQIQERDKGSKEDELEENQLCNESLVEAEKSGICAEMEKDMLALNSSELEIVERKVTEHADSEKEAVAITLCSPECTEPKEGSELESEQETISKNDAVMDESNTRSETECSTRAPQEEKENISTADLELKLDNDQIQAEEVLTQSQTNEEKTADLELKLDNDLTQAEEVLTQSQTNEEKTDILQTARNSEQVNLRVDADESTVEGEPTTEEANICLTLEEESRKNIEEKAAEEDDCVFQGSSEANSNLQNHDKDSQFDQTEVCGRRNSKSSGDVCVRKSSASRRSWLGRRLSEDLFTVPQKTNQSTANSEAGNPTQPQEVTLLPQGGEMDRTVVQPKQQLPNPPKRLGLLHRFKREPNKAKAKMQVPKILIQDFSDGTGTGRVVEEEGQEKLSSRERRRRRREQERKEKEEERLRKKKEKEKVKEKEKERKKPQTRGKSFQVPREKETTNEAQCAKSEAQTRRCSAPYTESYF